MRRAAAALAALLSACGGGGDKVPVQVSLGLDESTCGTVDPASVHFNCATSVGVWVREADTDGFAGTIIEQACVDLPGPDPTLAALPEVLSTVDLGGLSDRAVILELAVYGPGVAAEGCPTLDDFVIETLVWGETSPIRLSAADGALDLELFCEIYAATEICVEDCEIEYETCVNGDPAVAAGGEDCEGADAACYQLCDDGGGADDCYLACDAEYATCVEARCGTARDTCVSGCDDSGEADSCISIE